MNTLSPNVKSVEESIESLRKKVVIGPGNVPKIIECDINESNLIKDEKGFNIAIAIKKIEYWHFIQSADYHYFISRILFLHHIPEYSFFCGEQCIENYLKAYLKYKNQNFPLEHDLRELLKRCRKVKTNVDDFIQNDKISLVISKFEPFYELPRYPVQKKRPKDGLVFWFPDDIYILDYFVMKMRELLTIPSNTWDILKKGHYRLNECKQEFPNFYNTFFFNNINFS